MTVKAKTTKPVVTISRNVVKRTGAVVYLCKPETEGKDPYATTVINGKATGCTCDGKEKWHRVCKHMKHCQAKEQARGGIIAQAVEIVAQAEQAAEAAADAECAWYQQNYSSNVRTPLSREAYSSMYDVNNIA